MRERLLLCLVILAGTMLVRPAAAQDPSRHLIFSTLGGWTIFDPERDLRDRLYVGGRLGARGRYLGLEAAGGFSPTRQDAPGGRDVGWTHLSGNLMAYPLPGLPIEPYGLVGFGGEHFGGPGGEPGWHLSFDAGGGLIFLLSENIGLRLEARNVLFLPRTHLGDAHLNEIAISGGLSVALGGHSVDEDGDGVPDKLDKCPHTPVGCRVDASGCPLDSDGDGICDGVDQCPGTPRGAVVDRKGCPIDSDDDGVPDGIDKCPETPHGAMVDSHGCPIDSDGDGVPDGIDRCPNTPKGATVDARGCPIDSDGDGVPDGIDRCPNTPTGARVDRFGCPIEVNEKETEMLDTGMIRLQNVNFETAKATLLPESYPALDQVGEILTRWPELRIEIGGHTDSRGSAAYNQGLSEARASAVLDYLTAHFKTLRPEQFTAHGYGESKPLVPNTSPLNMAKNRRVEFVVLNKDVLKREKERRRLLPGNEGAPADTTRH